LRLGIADLTRQLRLLEVMPRLAGQLFRQRFCTCQIILEVAAGHNARRNFEPNLAFAGMYRYYLKVGKKRMVLLWCAQVPRAGVWVSPAVALHRASARDLTNSRHQFSSLRICSSSHRFRRKYGRTCEKKVCKMIIK